MKRLREVLNRKCFYAVGTSLAVADVPTQSMNHHIRIINDLEQGVVQWLKTNPLPTLGELIITGKLSDGVFFTHYGAFYGKGTTVAVKKYTQNKPLIIPARLLAKLDDLYDGATLICQVHPENYTSGSAAMELSGQKRLFMIGRLTSIALPSLEAQAYAIGFLHQCERASEEVFGIFDFLSNHMEVFVDSIDCFSKVREQSQPTKSELSHIESISESEIKAAFADIIGERFVPKDWGGRAIRSTDDETNN